MMSDDRKLYDLCRKYKYYYKAYQEVKHLEDVYWSKYLKKVFDEVVDKLEEVENEIIFLIFSELMGERIVMDIDVDYMYKYGSDKKIPVDFKLNIEGINEEFVHKLLDYVDDKDYSCVRSYSRGYNRL